jgi:hypothetical protein
VIFDDQFPYIIEIGKPAIFVEQTEQHLNLSRILKTKNRPIHNLTNKKLAIKF